MASSLLPSFQYDLRTCILEQEGVEIEPLLAHPDDRYVINGRFVRDRFASIVVEGLSYVVTPSIAYGSSDFARKGYSKATDTILKKFFPDSTRIEIPGYFEGGNTLFIPAREGISKPLFLHGLDPYGHYYLSHGKSSKNNSYLNKSSITRNFNNPADLKNFFFKISPASTTMAMKTALAKIGVKAIGISMNSDFLKKTSKHCNLYYHLDCFCHVLPDGRLIILNKKMLCKNSLVALNKASIVLIDLKCTEACTDLLNGISFYYDGNIKLIIPGLSQEIKDKLSQLVGIELISPDKPTIETQQAQLYSAHIDAAMIKKGYLKTSGKERPFPVKRHYITHDGKTMTLSERLAKEISNEIEQTSWLRRRYCNNPFLIDTGGLHCLTQELHLPARLGLN